MRLAIVLHLTGTILRVFGAAFLAPLLVALYYGETSDAIGFVGAGLLAAVAGQAMRRRVDQREWVLRRVEGMAVVAGTWLLVAVIGSVPYAVAGLGTVDALFESMSGITATGATIFTDFGMFGRGLLFWRSLSQWLGGMGVITLFIAVLPRLAIGGRQLFFTEAPGPTDDGLTPQVRKTAGLLWRLYAGLTLAEFVALMLAGMSAYDAICHAMTTIAAGGFSPNPESIMGYQSAAIEWIICGFMFLAGANFALQYRALRGRPRALFGDDEFRVYAGIVLVAAVALTGFLVQAGAATVDAVRAGLFQTLSILTTTGYASEDFGLWNDQARLVLLVLMFIGGCAGSAAGGPKVV
ncbi:MAG: TrkH family potassium uptake protein, partial [Vicinamibacterales bacterium]|nr:TrkH family potassium uptake protein [Vicinamibacterales bacterium]